MVHFPGGLPHPPDVFWVGGLPPPRNPPQDVTLETDFLVGDRPGGPAGVIWKAGGLGGGSFPGRHLQGSCFGGSYFAPEAVHRCPGRSLSPRCKFWCMELGSRHGPSRLTPSSAARCGLRRAWCQPGGGLGERQRGCLKAVWLEIFGPAFPGCSAEVEPRDPPRSPGPAPHINLHEVSAQQANSKAISRHPKNPASLQVPRKGRAGTRVLPLSYGGSVERKAL